MFVVFIAVMVEGLRTASLARILSSLFPPGGLNLNRGAL